jgi:hypothetical protein
MMDVFLMGVAIALIVGFFGFLLNGFSQQDDMAKRKRYALFDWAMLVLQRYIFDCRSNFKGETLWKIAM